MPKDKPLLLRLAFIDRQIREGMAAGVLANCSSMAAGYEVSPKTIRRDIDYLRSQRDAPIAYDPRRRGYYYTEENYSLPAIAINESDLFGLYIAQKALSRHENTPIYQKLAAVFRKIEKSLPGKVSLQPCWVDARLSVIDDRQTVIDPRVWDAVAQGLHESRTLRIDYHKPGAPQPLAREVDPYHAAGFQGEWYLIGRCHLRRAVRTFAMSRIGQAATTGKTFIVPADFDFAALAARRFGIIGGDRDYTVKIRFAREHAPYVLEREWHGSQSIAEAADGSVVLTLTANHLLEVKRWVLSWGRGAKVLEPEELAEAVKQELAGALSAYG